MTTTSGERTVQRTHHAVTEQPMAGFRTRNVGPTNLGRAMDPFVNLDEFVMDRPIFRAHPHAGFSAVTYMFEDSEGTFVNRWSFGDEQLIGPGAMHWTQAGSGMFHEEVPVETGPPCHGIQMFVKLPAELELSEPQAFHLDRDEVPEVRVPGCRTRVLAGSHSGTSAPVGIANDLCWLDAHLDPDGVLAVAAPADESAFVLVVHGEVEIAGTTLAAHHAALLGDDGDELVLRAAGAAQVMVCTGTPLHEPLEHAGPFMMSTRERLHDATRRMRSGEMGRLDSSF